MSSFFFKVYSAFNILWLTRSCGLLLKMLNVALTITAFESHRIDLQMKKADVKIILNIVIKFLPEIC